MKIAIIGAGNMGGAIARGIAAAIAATDSGRTLVVRSVRRASGWKRAAREEAVCRF